MVFFRFILCVCVLSIYSYGEIESHLKKIIDRSHGHNMPNIDFIYMINLDKRPEKWKMSLDQLTPYGVYPYRFSAVNGWELTLEDINDIGMKFTHGMKENIMATWYPLDGNFQPSHELIHKYGRTYFCHCFARGTMGIILSHLSVLQDAYEQGYETIWVMEDDIEVIRDPRQLSGLILDLDQTVGYGQWDVLFTDRDIRDANGNYVPACGAGKRPNFVPRPPNHYAHKEKVGDQFYKVGSRFGAHSMILRRSGIQKILEFIKIHGVFLPYDMDYYLPYDIKLYTVVEDVVSNLAKALSDNGNPNYVK